MTKFGVVVFPGSNCDRDVAYVTNLLGQPTRMVWHQETDIADLDVVILPGGFSYGDYLRCGAIAQFSPVMPQVIDHAQKGKFVLGICNGFQVLTEAGLLPGALVEIVTCILSAIAFVLKLSTIIYLGRKLIPQVKSSPYPLPTAKGNFTLMRRL